MDDERLLSYLNKFQNMSLKIQHDMQNKMVLDGFAPKLTGTQFEEIVFDELIKAGIPENSISHSPQKFPDFVISDINGEKIGLEVKKTDSVKWETIGGSIYESLRNDISETFVVMAKLGGAIPEVRLRKYAECIADLRVTHSPRFYLNMDLAEGEDYLTVNDSKDLLDLSGNELNKRIRELLRSNKSTWWSEAETVKFSDLSDKEKDNYRIDGLALFPEIFGGNYDNFAPWLIYNCLVWCGNVRDIFSAGGKVKLLTKNLYISAVMGRAYNDIKYIRERIINMSEAELHNYWHLDSDTENINNCIDRMEIWFHKANDSLKISEAIVNENKTLKQYAEWANEDIEQHIRSEFFDALREKILNEV